MPLDLARRANLCSLSRTHWRAGAAALVLLFGCESLQNAVANGDTRTISFHHVHTGEDLTITYKRDGRYDPAAMEKINWEMRDWRREKTVKMDPHLIDLLWEVHREVGSKVPIQVICGYRSPETNAMLRARTRGVAQFSQHMVGKAMDFYMPDVPLAKIREVGFQLQRGGVGFYPTSGSPFVHLDTGNVRHWPQVSREYLAKIFPDGKTVHIPADGRPMKNYALALAEIKARGNDSGSFALASNADTGTQADQGGLRKLFASLFSRKDFNKKDEGDDEDSQITTVHSRPAAAPAPVAVAALDKKPTDETRVMPTPRPRPTTEIASLDANQKPQQVASLGNRVPLPRAITGNTESLALGYAANDPFMPRNPMVLEPQAAERPLPRPAHRGHVTAAATPAPAATRDADAAIAPASLFDNNTMQYVGEMHQPLPYDAAVASLAAPISTAVRAHFGINPAHQPAMSRFAGPAVVALPTVYFGRQASLQPDRFASRVN